MREKTKLSLIIPAYNEEKLIVGTLDEIARFLDKKKYSWEVVVVDDGSKDDTQKLVSSYKNKRIKLVKLKKNSGKGAALRKGFLKADGEYRIFTDADLSVDIKYIDSLLGELEEGKIDVAIASRRVKGAKIKKHQPWHRENMGRVYTFLTSLIIGMDLKDYTCGMKGFTVEAANKVFSKALIDRWAYDSEILYLAKKYGYKIKQVPIIWENREDTRVKLKKVILESFIDLLKVRVNDLLGKYNIN